jgi:hypothetical protein
MHGMYKMSIAYMLKTLFYHRGNELTHLMFQHVKKNPYLWNELREEMANYDRDTSFVANLERMYV